MSDESLKYAAGESHDCVVPAKAPNKDPHGSAEGLEGRRSVKENTGESNSSRTQSRVIESRGLEGVREAAKRDRGLRFTALLHHVTEGLLRDSFYSLQRQAAPGVDQVTWQQYEQGLIGSAFRGSSALHAVGDSYVLLTRPSPQLNTVELRFQFRYAAPQPPRLLQLDPHTLWFSASGQASAIAPARHKVEKDDVTQALASIGERVRYNQLREQIMQRTECSKRTAQLAIIEACQQGRIVQADGHYRLPL